MEGENQQAQQNNYLLPASIVVAGLMVSASIIYLVGSNNSPRTGAPSGGNQLAAVGGGPSEVGPRDVILGEPNAPVTVIEYGDFQCPFCVRFHERVGSRLRDEYITSGKVKMVFRNFQFLGPESSAAGEAAECAKDQGKFWAFHDAIYDEEARDGREHNGNLNRDFFVRTAQTLGLNVSDFSSCIDTGKYTAQVAADTKAASEAGVNSTPTTFINGRLVRGAVPYEQFMEVIEEELAKI